MLLNTALTIVQLFLPASDADVGGCFNSMKALNASTGYHLAIYSMSTGVIQPKVASPDIDSKTKFDRMVFECGKGMPDGFSFYQVHFGQPMSHPYQVCSTVKRHGDISTMCDANEGPLEKDMIKEIKK